MEQAVKWHSPRSIPGSFISAAVIHGILYGAVIVILGAGLFHKTVELAPEAELTYDMLDAPPPAPPPPPVVREQPKELQDEKSEVTGTQKKVETKTASSVGSDQAAPVPAMPYYKVKPKYPRAALVAGTEGWILMNVDVKEDGTVDNVRVVDGTERSMFQDEARRAVEKWKYKPFLDTAGKPYVKKDHQVRVDFKLNEATM
jgi:protein TonB